MEIKIDDKGIGLVAVQGIIEAYNRMMPCIVNANISLWACERAGLQACGGGQKMNVSVE